MLLIAKEIAAQEKVEKEKLPCEKVEKQKVVVPVFKIEAKRKLITQLRGHLEVLSQLRAEHPGGLFQLHCRWDNIRPEQELQRHSQRQLESQRVYPTERLETAEEEESEILQKLQTELEELEGEGGDKKRRRLEEVQD